MADLMGWVRMGAGVGGNARRCKVEGCNRLSTWWHVTVWPEPDRITDDRCERHRPPPETTRLPDGAEMIPSAFADPPVECHAQVMVEQGTYGDPGWHRTMFRCQRLDAHPLPDMHRAAFTDPNDKLTVLRWRDP